MAELQKITDPTKKVTDPVLLNFLARRGVDKDYVEFIQDYGKTIKGKSSPYAKFYRDLKSNKRFMVASGLPMVKIEGHPIEPAWFYSESQEAWYSKANLFSCIVSETIKLTCLSDQPYGAKAGDSVTFQPQLFLNGEEVKPKNVYPEWLEIDPTNENYHQNVLEWDYGVCKRRLRIIQGSLLGSWVFSEKPTGEVRIKYNQIGDFKLGLGQFKLNDDEELVKLEDFDGLVKLQGGYPVVVSDSQTFYPDANAVDGYVGRNSGSAETWAAVRGGVGTEANYTAASAYAGIWFANQVGKYWLIRRGAALFYITSLPEDITIDSASVSLYGQAVLDDANMNPYLNLYSVTPAGTTQLVAADYNLANWGSTAFSTSLTEATWNPAGYNPFALNASGLAALVEPVAKFGIRESHYEAPNSDPGWGGSGNLDSRYAWYTAEQGDGFKPKLIVNYTINAGMYIWDGIDWTLVNLVRVVGFPIPAIVELFFNTTFSTQDYTQWVTAAQGTVPAAAEKIVIWAGHSTSSANTGRSRGLYNGVEKCVCTSNWQYGYACRWSGDGLGIAATVACQIREGGLGAYWVYAQVGCYYT